MSTITLPNATVAIADIVGAATAEQRAELRTALNEPEKVKRTLDIFTREPRQGEQFFFVGFGGVIESRNYETYYAELYGYATLHRTRASAELELAHTKARVILERRCVALGGRIGNKPDDGEDWYVIQIVEDKIVKDVWSDYQTNGGFFFLDSEKRDSFMQSDNFEALLREFYYMEAK